jgi:hypothetical protein
MYVISDFKLSNNQPIYQSQAVTGNTVTRRSNAQSFSVQYTISGDTADVLNYVHSLNQGTNKIDLGLNNPHAEIVGLHLVQAYPAGAGMVSILDSTGTQLNASVCYYVQFSGHSKTYMYQHGVLTPSLRLPVQIAETVSTRPLLNYRVTAQKIETDSDVIQQIKIEGAETW